MGTSAIQWTDKTWTPLTGCTRLDLGGCDNCYAFQLHDMRHVAWKRGRWDAAPKQYHQPFSRVQLLPDRLEEPLRWRKPSKVFLTSMGDLFHEDVPNEYLARIWDTMFDAGITRGHTFQVLTKRAERLPEFDAWMNQTQLRRIDYSNVWLGTSVENQQAADARIEPLMRTHAAIHFLSMEPLLGPVSFTHIAAMEGPYTDWLRGEVREVVMGEEGLYARFKPLRWVIVGGESGPRARPMDLQWLRDIIAQCREAGTAIFVKQLGTVWAKQASAKDRHGGDIDEWPEDLRIREFPLEAR